MDVWNGEVQVLLGQRGFSGLSSRSFSTPRPHAVRTYQFRVSGLGQIGMFDLGFMQCSVL